MGLLERDADCWRRSKQHVNRLDWVVNGSYRWSRLNRCLSWSWVQSFESGPCNESTKDGDWIEENNVLRQIVEDHGDYAGGDNTYDIINNVMRWSNIEA